ncbi:MAG: hypothetical protein A4E44_00147 [Methanosaeta sp. PtaB.Bin018]|nr:MAG: hypothetical protein A4E44_00147 [Methanosaeta sp. PtaB.Bin018]OPY48121.1 MAG: hypothetical protein A4E46_00096 [Methanosaeta sp. PtaU1.Bin016]
MTAETHALRRRRKFLLEQLSRAADEIRKIDNRLNNILAGNRGQGGAGAA